MLTRYFYLFELFFHQETEPTDDAPRSQSCVIWIIPRSWIHVNYHQILVDLIACVETEESTNYDNIYGCCIWISAHDFALLFHTVQLILFWEMEIKLLMAAFSPIRHTRVENFFCIRWTKMMLFSVKHSWDSINCSTNMIRI
jgi:hypothetical protein